MTISTVKSHSIYVVGYKGDVVQEIKPETEHKNAKVYATATKFREYLSRVLQGFPSSFNSKPTILEVQL